jgi:lysophospholipase L1-like esterase
MPKTDKRLLILLVLLCPALLRAQATSSSVWVGSWSCSQYVPELSNALAQDALYDVTVRQIFRLSLGGTVVRVHVSNAFGRDPLRFTSVHLAHSRSASSAEIDAATDKSLTFSGKTEVIVPPGAELISDPVQDPAAPLSNLAVTFQLDFLPVHQTGHPGSRATSYYVLGNLVSAANFTDVRRVDHWYYISAIDVLAPEGSASVVALGDSITDGHGATTNGNDRWTDVLAERLQGSPATRQIGVLNQGIGGNHLLTDGTGPNALARLDRDVLAQTGARWLIVFEGINDIGGLTRNGEVSVAEHTALVDRMLAAYHQIITVAHAHGMRVIGATLTPYMGSGYYHPGPASEADRQAVNIWIRASGEFDAVIDFDAAARDRAHPDRFLPAYDSGDHLHPSPAGYRAMGNAVDLSLFAQ